MTAEGDTWIRRTTRAVTDRPGLVVLALLAYVPALASSPGRMPADTKLYLYLDPAGLLGRAASTFESNQFAGWVPHQQITYLWPSGPWFWLFDAVGVPDWIAHRLWIATVMFAAGAGVRWAGRLLGLSGPGAFVGAMLYQLSPYLLAYVSRTSVLLLPWAGLGWIVGLTVRAAFSRRRPDAPPDGHGLSTLRARSTPWRDPALIALVVLTVGSVNATALILIVPAPALWLVHAALQRRITWLDAALVALRVGVLALAVSGWWIAMLIVQARHGSPVLSFSETVEDVSRNSTGSEILRSLGYWLFYQRDPVAPTTTASIDYLVSLRTIAVSYLVTILGVIGLTRCSWPERRYAALCVAVGAVLAVGVHPIGSPSPLVRWIAGDPNSGLTLALRSSTRATPVLLFGIALGAGALISAIAVRQWSAGARNDRARGVLVVAGAALLVLANLPSLVRFDLVDPAIDRDQDPPQAWTDAVDHLDTGDGDRSGGGGGGARILQLPGAEFGAFRWGYTTDQPVVGLTDKPLVTRDLLPLGSGPAMDLLYALDDRFQEGTAEAASVAPLARLLGSDTIWLTNDMAFERFRTARPELVDALLTGDVEGLDGVVRFGDPVVNRSAVATIDPTSLSDDRVGRPISPVALIGVDDAVPVVRAKDASVVVSGSGDGLVDAAAAGSIDGHELVRYSASLGPTELADAVAEAGGLIVTDSNRDRAHHWRGSQDVHGHTEPGGPADDVLVATGADQRLDVFASDDERTQTVAVQDGPVTAIASSYGEPYAYRPEARAVMAIDGDPTTAWSVADHGDPVGEVIRFDLSAPLASDVFTLHQILPRPGGRTIAAIDVRVDDEAPFRAELSAASVAPAGEEIRDPSLVGASRVEIEIAAVSPGDAGVAASRDGVGFTEIDFGVAPTVEYIRPPVDALDAAVGEALTMVLTRLRTDPENPWRSDPEPAMRRLVVLPDARSLDVSASLRLDARASDQALADLLAPATTGPPPPLADRRLTGTPEARGAAAVDGDPTTAWITPFDGAVGATLSFVDADVTGNELALRQRQGDYSAITRLEIANNDDRFVVDVPPADEDGNSTVPLPRALQPGTLTLSIDAIDARTTIDRRYGDRMTLPASISELTTEGLGTTVVDPTGEITGECLEFLTVDGTPVTMRFSTTAGALIDGQPVVATACAPVLDLAAGDHRLNSSPATNALQVDRVVLRDVDAPVGTASAPSAVPVTIEQSDARRRTVEVGACPDGCWIVLGEGFNEAWTASIDDGADLGAPALVDGGFNGWWLEPSVGPRTVHLAWSAQGPVTAGLIIAALAVLFCIAAIALSRSPRRPVAFHPSLRLRQPTTPRRSLAAALTLVATAALVISPLWGLLMVVPAAWSLAPRPSHAPWWRRRPLELCGLLATVAVALSTIVIERRNRPWPNAGWTESFDQLHGLALAGVLLVAVGAAFGSDARIGREPTP